MRSKGARLYFRQPTGKERGQWVIRDGAKSIRTGCAQSDIEEAERRLAEYVGEKYTTSREKNRRASAISIADVLNIYVVDKGTNVSRPGELAQRVAALSAFFGEKMLIDINGPLCRKYAEKRGSISMARRELQDLRAAINHHRKEGLCSEVIEVVLPEKEEPRERWLTKEEAVRMAKAAWRYREMQKGHPTKRRSRRHIVRFMLIALYTGTRSKAICNAALAPRPGCGHFDLEAGLFYRQAQGVKKTKKRQPTCRIPHRLLCHLRRWKRLGIAKEFAVEFFNAPVSNIHKAFARVAEEAKVEGVTPHTLRHTAITWAMQDGWEINKVCEFFGVTQEVVERVYWHHHPDFQADHKGPRKR